MPTKHSVQVVGREAEAAPRARLEVHRAVHPEDGWHAAAHHPVVLPADHPPAAGRVEEWADRVVVGLVWILL